MAPERFRGEGDARADVYALGLTLYELLTLRPAFDGPTGSSSSSRSRPRSRRGPRRSTRGIPRDLETIVLKAIDKDPRRRYPTADALAEDLRRFLDDEPIRRASVDGRRAVRPLVRRNPAIAVLATVLAAVLVLATIGSLAAANGFRALAGARSGPPWPSAARREAEAQRKAADLARAAGLAETTRATFGATRALRDAHSPGWRKAALGNLARLATMPTPRRDLLTLRSEAAAALGDFDVELVAPRGEQVRSPLGRLQPRRKDPRRDGPRLRPPALGHRGTTLPYSPHRTSAPRSRTPGPSSASRPTARDSRSPATPPRSTSCRATARSRPGPP